MSSKLRVTNSQIIPVLFACLFLTACGSEEPSRDQGRELVIKAAQSQRDYGREDIARLLDDGVLSESDFNRSFDELKQCYEERGYQVKDPVVNPADGLTLLFEVVNSGRTAEVAQKDALDCSDPHEQLGAIYTSVNPQVMDEAVRKQALSCIEDRGGVVYEEAANFEEMVGDPSEDGGEQRRTAAQCVLESVVELYPDIPMLTVGY